MTGFIAQTATGESTPGHADLQHALRGRACCSSSITLVINMISIRLVRRFREAY